MFSYNKSAFHYICKIFCYQDWLWDPTNVFFLFKEISNWPWLQLVGISVEGFKQIPICSYFYMQLKWLPFIYQPILAKHSWLFKHSLKSVSMKLYKITEIQKLCYKITEIQKLFWTINNYATVLQKCYKTMYI